MSRPIHYKIPTLRGILVLLYLCSFHFCYSQDVHLESQFDVDAFDPSTTIVNGNLYIRPPLNVISDITDLSNLSNLTTVNGDLLIWRNFELVNLDGLNGLSYVQGDLELSSNTALTNINGIGELDSVGGSILLEQLQSLVTIDNFDNLIAVGMDFTIYNCDALERIIGINNLESIGGNLSIDRNDFLQEIEGFQQLQSIGSELEFYQMPLLFNLNAFNNLSTVGSRFYMTELDDLTHLDNFSSLNSVGGEVYIARNAKITNLDGLSNLQSVGGDLSIQVNRELKNIDGLTNLTFVGDDLVILTNHELENIDGLHNLTHLGGGILMNFNLKITHIDGLSNLTEVSKSISFGANDALENLNGLSNISYVEDNLVFKNNDALTSLDGLENITSLRGNLSIFNNSQLTDCCAIQQLLSDSEAVNGVINISENPSECSSQNEVLNKFCGMHLIVNTNPPCVNADNGSIQVGITGYDTIPFNYHWVRQEDGAEGMGVSNEDFFLIENLSKGTYDLIVTNPRPDSASRNSIILSELDGSIFEIIEINSTNSSNENANGSIQIEVSGGIPPFNISWSGTGSNGNIPDLTDQTFNINNIVHGTYDIIISDSTNTDLSVSITLLDETVPVFLCEEPLDIVILNDVSGSVDAVEYKESKIFFVNFLNEVNIGLEDDKSRASIIEWSSKSDQKVIIPMTGDYSDINKYLTADRAFSGNTYPHDAMSYGYNYLENVGREDVEKVLVLSTDGTVGQISASLVALADQFKAQGYHIVTIAFDRAFSDSQTRKTLQNVASINALAPGAPAYSDLDEDLAKEIVNLYLCPIDPGSSATVYFNRDGAIEILGLEPEKNCPYPEFVEVEFKVEAFRELSIPSGTPVTFYLNDPTQYGATKITTWKIPCTIPVGSSETYNVVMPISGPSLIYAVLNDDGINGAPINFPITDLQEIAYSNNIDSDNICVGTEASVQAIKYSTTPIPACDTIVNYTINVCNISDTDAYDVSVTDEYPDGFELIGTTVNTNNCATDNGSSFDIPVNCCVTLNLTYDASGAQLGYYNDQDVVLNGPANQTYINYDGATSQGEDVSIDGSIDCPSTIIEFTKEVNVTESCDDAFLVYTFTINNEMNIPIQGLTFTDIVPSPSTWVFQPYSIEGLSIGNLDIEGNEARFTINEVAANTAARFSMDMSIGKFPNDGEVVNTATLDNVPDPVNGGFKSMTSNTTTTQITASPTIGIPDTIIFQLTSDTLELNAVLNGLGDVFWTSAGDGIFLDENNESTAYILGSQDKIDQQISLFISVETDCSENGEAVIVLLQECQLVLDEIIIGDCDNNGTSADPSDDNYQVMFNVLAQYPSGDSLYYCIVENDTLGPFTYGILESITLDANGVSDILNFVDSQFDNCNIQEEVNQQSCSDECNLNFESFLISDCDDNGTPADGTDDTYSITFSVFASNPGIDSLYLVIIANDTLGTFPYESENTLSLPADGVEYVVHFEDSENADCMLTETVNVESCSDQCLLSLDSFTTSVCSDNGTPTDYTDDTYTVTFSLSALNAGASESYFVIIGNDTIGTYAYESEQVITLSADGEEDVITFADTEIGNCILIQSENVQSCSNECILSLDEFTTSECDDSGTPQDIEDDTYTITFNVSAMNAGSDASYLVIIESDTLGPLSYESEQTLSLSADGVEDVIIFMDSQNENCILSESTNVESCSHECLLNLDVILVSECDDNGTSTNNTDDTYSITYILSASNPGSDDTYLAMVGGDTIGVFPYNSTQEVNMPADGIEDAITFQDSQFEDCLLETTFSEESCSDDCNLSFLQFDVSECQDETTSEEHDFDHYFVTFNLSSPNSSSSSFHLLLDNDTIGAFQYGEDEVLVLSADGLEDVLHFVDQQNENCSLTEIVRVESCSESCVLSIEEFSISECNDNNTSDIQLDDAYTITFKVSAEHPYQDSSFYIFLDDESLGTFSYGQEYTLQLLANGKETTIHFMDSNLEYCFGFESIDLAYCSETEPILDDITIPNVFSPNDDGSNDNWTIEMNNDSEIITCDIYDRWGNLIYSTERGTIPHWDGTFNGKLVSQGVYVYKVIYLDGLGASVSKFGDVTLIR